LLSSLENALPIQELIMKTFVAVLGTAALCAFLPVLPVEAAGPPAVNAEPMDLDVETLATISKEKSKTSTIADGMKAGRDKVPGSQDQCGQVNIANQNNNQSNSGIQNMLGKQQTVVVQGPVINMANCK
jgi:hypothetical protein